MSAGGSATCVKRFSVALCMEITQERKAGRTNGVSVTGAEQCYGASISLENRLRGVMQFLKSKVKNKQRILLASEEFGFNSKMSRIGNSGERLGISTAKQLVNGEVTTCIFCSSVH